MTRDEIERFSRIEPYCFETDREEDWYKIGCIDGLDAADADPDVSSLWHSANEEPKSDSLILYESIYDDILLIRYKSMLSSMKLIRRWAYTKDLLPKGGEK